MTHISRRKIDPKIDKHISESLVFVLQDLGNHKDAENFLNSLLSDTERVMISKRLVAAFLIRHGVETKEIEELLKLTRDTIYKLKLRIQLNKDAFDSIFGKLEKQRRNIIVKQILYKILEFAIANGSGRVLNPFKSKFEPGQLR